MKIVALTYPLLFLASFSSNADTKSDYDALFKNCIDEHGTMNNGVIDACSGTVSEEAKKEITRRYFSIYGKHQADDPDIAKKFEVSQKAWLDYRNSYCSFIFSYTGSPSDGYCHMRLNSARALELRELDGE